MSLEYSIGISTNANGMLSWFFLVDLIIGLQTSSCCWHSDMVISKGFIVGRVLRAHHLSIITKCCIRDFSLASDGDLVLIPCFDDQYEDRYKENLHSKYSLNLEAAGGEVPFVTWCGILFAIQSTELRRVSVELFCAGPVLVSP